MGCAGMERIKIEDDKGTVALHEEAQKDGWTVISMKNDWRRIFASFEE